MTMNHLFFFWPPFHTNGFVLVVRTSAMRISLTGASLDFAASVSFLSLSHIQAQGCAHTDTYTSACLQEPYSSVSGSFCLPSAYRLEDRGSKGGLRERRVARQNGWSHEQRSVYKPKAEAEQEEEGEGESQALSPSTIIDWKRKKGSLPWQSQLEVQEAECDTRRHTLAHTPPLSQIFFFFPSQLKQQMVRGRVGSPPTRTHIHWLKHKHTLASKTPNPARGLLLTAWSCPHFVWALKEAYLCLLCWGEISTARSEDWRRRQQRRQEGDETCENPLLKKSSFSRKTKHRLMSDNCLHWVRTVILKASCYWVSRRDDTADTKWSQRGPFLVEM